jgi:hypothetical protein
MRSKTLEHIQKLEQELEALKASVQLGQEPKIWEPVFGENYFSINSVHQVILIKNDHPYDQKIIAAGNCYKTEELAERAAERRKHIRIFENKMLEFAQGYKHKKSARNYHLYFGSDDGGWGSCYNKSARIPLVIYMSEQQAKKAVQWADKYYPNGL